MVTSRGMEPKCFFPKRHPSKKYFVTNVCLKLQFDIKAYWLFRFLSSFKEYILKYCILTRNFFLK